MGALLTPEQSKAREVAKAIGELREVFVTSPPGETRLRIQCFQSFRNEFIGRLAEWGWKPVFIGMAPRMAEAGAVMIEVYELDVEAGLPKPAKDQVHRDDRDERSPNEIKAEETGKIIELLRKLGLKKA